MCLAAAGAYLVWHYTIRPAGNGDRAAAADSVEYYQCGMHPWIRKDEPGRCPICGMNLTPVYRNDTVRDDGTVVIDPVMVQNIGVRTDVVRRRNLAHTIRTSGIVDFNEQTLSYITTKFSGYIEKLYANESGMRVHKGQKLFEFYSPDLVAAQQEYLQALRYQRKAGDSGGDFGADAGALLESARNKLLLWDIAPAQVRAIEQAGAVQRTLTFYSPADGILVEKNAIQGMEVRPGMNLFGIAGVADMWVYADVYENELGFIREGLTAVIGLTYNPGETLQGKVSSVYPYLDPQSRTSRVRIEVQDRGGLLKKDMYVTVVIRPGVAQEVLAVPAQAVIHSGPREIVVLALGNGRFRPVEVSLGVLADNFYEIKQGLSEGDTIVTSSQFLIDSESNLRSGMSSMNAMPGMQHDSAAADHSGRQPD